jgi:hypothetical protein
MVGNIRAQQALEHFANGLLCIRRQAANEGFYRFTCLFCQCFAHHYLLVVILN